MGVGVARACVAAGRCGFGAPSRSCASRDEGRTAVATRPGCDAGRVALHAQLHHTGLEVGGAFESGDALGATAERAQSGESLLLVAPDPFAQRRTRYAALVAGATGVAEAQEGLDPVEAGLEEVRGVHDLAAMSGSSANVPLESPSVNLPRLFSRGDRARPHASPSRASAERRCIGRRPPLAAQLPPLLASLVHPAVLVPHVLDFTAKRFVALSPGRAQGWIRLAGFVDVVGRRSDLQHLANRPTAPYSSRWSSMKATIIAVGGPGLRLCEIRRGLTEDFPAGRGRLLAWRSSRFSRSSSLMFARSSVEGPARRP